MTSRGTAALATAEVDLELTIAAKTELAENVIGLELRDPNGRELPRWEPGAHIDLRLPNEMIRQYSLCGDPADRYCWTVGVLREPEGRGGSEWLHTVPTAGDRISVRGPRNNFPLVSAPRTLFVAGGIGITPLLPMIETLAAAGQDWQLLYGGRTARSMAFRERLLRHGPRVLIRPEDEYGLLDLDGFLGAPSEDTVVYCCGPEKLLVAIEERCATWRPGSLHLERFHPRDGALDGESTSFDVVLAQTGLTVRVAADESIVDALSRVGVNVPTSCREGTCGTCETAVLDGLPDHRDSFLTDEEMADNSTMMVCCSRSFSESITLDL